MKISVNEGRHWKTKEEAEENEELQNPFKNIKKKEKEQQNGGGGGGKKGGMVSYRRMSYSLHNRRCREVEFNVLAARKVLLNHSSNELESCRLSFY